MNCIKNERIKNEIIKNERIKNERIKNELIKKRTDPFLSWAQMGLNHEKIGDRKSRDTLPLSSLKLRHFYLNPYR